MHLPLLLAGTGEAGRLISIGIELCMHVNNTADFIYLYTLYTIMHTS